ncbi:MAG: Fpg/Nei family DNA glycosylase [Acidimicrobiales bacterium]
MPELPEVETLRQDLSREVVGKKVKSVAVSNGRSVRRHPSAKHFRALLEGRSIKSVSRLGKYLLLILDNKDVLVVHLGMSGQLLRVKSAKEPKPKHTHVVIVFTQGGELRYVDPRTFGEMFVSTQQAAAVKDAKDGKDGARGTRGAAEGSPARPGTTAPPAASALPPGMAGGDGAALRRQVPELAHLGFDPIEDMMSWDRFGLLLHQRRVGLKALLMDQQFVAGIGNLYSDEILFGAGLRFDHLSDKLSATEVRRLYRAMVETLSDAIKHRGSTLVDEQYRDLFGEAGDYQGSHQVYDREGQPCRRCRNPIVRVKLGGRSTFYCEHCQV